MQERVYEVNGLNLAYTVVGQGPSVLLVHGFALSRRLWAPQVRGLADRYRLVLPDLRGFGSSDAGEAQPTIETYAQDIAALLDVLNIQRIVFCGLSMGGYIAFAFYRLFPQRVQALVLADTRAQADTPEIRQAREEQITLIDREGTTALADVLWPRFLAPENAERDPALVREVRAMIEGASARGAIGALRAMMDRPDSTPLLPQITCPTLIIVGEQDSVTPRADAELMAARIPQAKLKVIAGAGHLSNLERPDDFNQALRAFLAEVVG